MRRNAVETIGRYNMLPAGSRVIVGFSGGADSVALLDFLWKLHTESDWQVEAAFDGVHFSEKGHAAFARGLEQKLAEMGF